MLSRPNRVLWAVILLSALPATLDAQARRQSDRLVASAWAGGFVNMGGFSDGESFFQFDEGSGLFDDFGFGGSVHYALGGGFLVGVEGLFASPDYTRFDRDEGTELGTGSGSVYALMANGRLVGSPGPITFVLNGGAGFASWDIEELGSRDTDVALDFGIGLDVRTAQRLTLFGEYTWWWIFHEKDDRVVNNTARANLLRAGLRVGLF